MPGIEEFPNERIWQLFLDKEKSGKLLAALRKNLKKCGSDLSEERAMILQIIEECEGIGELRRGASFRQVFFKRKQFEYVSVLTTAIGIPSPLPLMS